MTYSDDELEVISGQVLPPKIRACTHWRIPKSIQSLRGRQVLVVSRNTGPDAAAPLPPLQPVERPAEHVLESSRTGQGLRGWDVLVHFMNAILSPEQTVTT